MIEYNSTNQFELSRASEKSAWLSFVISSEDKVLGDINFIFCDDDYLHGLNVRFLNHDTLTDIISFDYTSGDLISGDIYISIERVADNATNFKVSFNEELCRVMVHGVLHYCGYGDKSLEESQQMRSKENTYLSLYSDTFPTVT